MPLGGPVFLDRIGIDVMRVPNSSAERVWDELAGVPDLSSSLIMGVV